MDDVEPLTYEEIEKKISLMDSRKVRSVIKMHKAKHGKVCHLRARERGYKARLAMGGKSFTQHMSRRYEE